LKMIRRRIGSQWSSRKTGVIRSHFLAPVTRRSAANGLILAGAGHDNTD